MPDQYAHIDALGIYLTGAGYAGETQNDATASLGGIRSGTRVKRLAALVSDPIPPIIVLDAFGGNGTGNGTLVADTSDSVQWTAPSGTIGTAVSMANGEIKLVEDNDADKAVLVYRASADSLAGRMTLALSAPYNNVIGLSNVANADRVSGITTYRGMMLKADGLDLSDVYIWIETAPGVHVALEAPSSGAIQTIADEETAPSGLSWNNGTTYGTGLHLASLTAGSVYGLWIRRVISAAASVEAYVKNSINVRFTVDGVTYDDMLRGLYRIEDTTADPYELYIGVDDDPDFDAAPADTSTGVAFSYALTPPGSGIREYRATVRERNVYDLVGLNIYTRSIWINSTGGEEPSTITAPYDVSLTDGDGGLVEVRARYSAESDDDPGDTWAIYYRGDATDPTPGVDTPDTSSMTAPAYFGGTAKYLNATIGPFPEGATVHVIVRARRASDSEESSNTTASTITVGTMDPLIPQWRGAFLGESNLQRLGPETFSEDTTTYDVTENVRCVMNAGVTQFLVGSTIIWQIKYDGANPENNGFWTTLGILQETISGAASETPVDTVSATEIYVSVEDVRRLKIDLSANTISIAALWQVTGDVVTSRDDDPIVEFDFHTLFQVYDPYVQDRVTVASLDTDGVLSLAVPWRQCSSTGDFD